MNEQKRGRSPRDDVEAQVSKYVPPLTSLGTKKGGWQNAPPKKLLAVRNCKESNSTLENGGGTQKSPPQKSPPRNPLGGKVKTRNPPQGEPGPRGGPQKFEKMDGGATPLERVAKPRVKFHTLRGPPRRETPNIKLKPGLIPNRKRTRGEEQLLKADTAHNPHTPPQDITVNLMDIQKDTIEEVWKEGEKGMTPAEEGHPLSVDAFGTSPLELHKAGDNIHPPMPLPNLIVGQITPRQEAGPRIGYPANHAEYYTYWIPVKVETGLQSCKNPPKLKKEKGKERRFGQHRKRCDRKKQQQKFSSDISENLPQ